MRLTATYLYRTPDIAVKRFESYFRGCRENTFGGIIWGMETTTERGRGRPPKPEGERYEAVRIYAPREVMERVRRLLRPGERSGAAVAGLVRACEEREQSPG